MYAKIVSYIRYLNIVNLTIHILHLTMYIVHTTRRTTSYIDSQAVGNYIRFCGLQHLAQRHGSNEIWTDQDR